MVDAVIYIHGKGGSAEEAAHYRPLFGDCDVVGLDYAARTPWEAETELPGLFDAACKQHGAVTLIANSIGAYFAMTALSNKRIARAYFISPIVNMQKLIGDMMAWANVTEAELREQKEIQTAFGQTLSWEYLCYAREHPLSWTCPTHILYGEQDGLTSYDTVAGFAGSIGATLTVMQGGEHWFHTRAQLDFMDDWLRRHI